jgi:peptidyl-prolyl isomerase E (cyclophilin E)
LSNNIVWTEESWLQKYANAEDNKNQESAEAPATANSDEDSDKEEAQTSAPSKGEKSRVYLDIQIAGSLAGRIEIEVRRKGWNRTC